MCGIIILVCARTNLHVRGNTARHQRTSDNSVKVPIIRISTSKDGTANMFIIRRQPSSCKAILAIWHFFLVSSKGETRRKLGDMDLPCNIGQLKLPYQK